MTTPKIVEPHHPPSNGEVLMLRIKAPEDEKYHPWMQQEFERYKAAVAYVAFFIESRAKMGDVDTNDMWAEFKMNVCLRMRDGFDVLGEQ